MKTIEEIRAIFAADRFAMNQGFVIDWVEGDSARCGVALNQNHQNAAGGVQGGVIFTLSDFAFAVATNHEQMGTVTLNSAVSFLSGVRGTTLTATARCIRRSKRVCFYEVEVEDDLGTQVAHISITGYISARE